MKQTVIFLQKKIFLDDELPLFNISEKNFTFSNSIRPKPFSTISLKQRRTAQKVTPAFQKKQKMNFTLKRNLHYQNLCYLFATVILVIILSLCQKIIQCSQSYTVFLQIGIKPEIIQQGNINNYLEITCLQIQFLSIHCYLKGSVYEMAN